MNNVKYSFVTNSGLNLSILAGDADLAFRKLKRQDQDNLLRLKKYEKNQLPPDGYSLPDIGYGISVAYRRIVND